MSQRPLDGRERAEDLSGVDLSNSGRHVLHLPPLLVQDHTVQVYRDILSAAGASCVNHSQPFSPRESSKSVASGPPEPTGAWPLGSQSLKAQRSRHGSTCQPPRG
jgi:hypothetical protein